MTDTCTLRISSWDGERPLPGQYLKADRGRTAYLILHLKPGRNNQLGALFCERLRPDRIPSGAVVHRWVWDKR